MTTIDWYFDFISPYAYFQFQRLDELDAFGTVRLHPVLFAGLLKAWEHKGPAEIPLKRRFTYRYATWYARRSGIKFKAPPAHPFPPLAPLRLAHALGAKREAVGAIFDYIWGEGFTPSDPQRWLALTTRLQASNEHLNSPAVKAALRGSTDAAVERGVFGVPTVFVENELYWGVDATDMAIDHLRGADGINDAEMQRVATMPAEVSRPEARI